MRDARDVQSLAPHTHKVLATDPEKGSTASTGTAAHFWGGLRLRACLKTRTGRVNAGRSSITGCAAARSPVAWRTALAWFEQVGQLDIVNARKRKSRSFDSLPLRLRSGYGRSG